MQEWTRWFREKQEAYGTIEDFARASGIKVRSVSDYRAGRIPRGPARAAIASVLGDSGPLPGRPIERIATLEERIGRLEATVAQLREVQGSAEGREVYARWQEARASELHREVQDRQEDEGTPGS